MQIQRKPFCKHTLGLELERQKRKWPLFFQSRFHLLVHWIEPQLQPKSSQTKIKLQAGFGFFSHFIFTHFSLIFYCFPPSFTFLVTSDLPRSTKCFSCPTMWNTAEITTRLQAAEGMWMVGKEGVCGRVDVGVRGCGGNVRKWHTTWSEQ